MTLSKLPSGWARLTVENLRQSGDYTLVGGPFGSDLTQSDYLSEPGVPVIRGTNLGGKESRFIDDGFVFVSEHKAKSLARNCAFPGDLLFTQRGTLGQVAVIPEQARFPRYVISQSQMKLTPDRERVDARYLYQYFRRQQTVDLLLSQTQATGVPHINLGILKRFPVLVPPLPEQRRIADVLDRAEALRAKRRAALAQLDTLTQAIFLDMFGKPKANERGWPMATVGEAGRVQLGRQRAPKYQSGIYSRPYIRVANVYEDEIDVSDVLSMDFDERDFAAYRLEPGDILLNEGQSTELVGRPAMWRNEVPDCCFQNTLLRFQADRSKAIPVFALAVFLYYLRSGEFAMVSSKTSNVAHLGAGRFAAMPFPLPPLPLQKEFARRAEAVEQLKSSYRESLAQLDALFASLQHRAFRGEL